MSLQAPGPNYQRDRSLPQLEADCQCHDGSNTGHGRATHDKAGGARGHLFPQRHAAIRIGRRTELWPATGSLVYVAEGFC